MADKAQPSVDSTETLLPCPFCGTDDAIVGEGALGWFVRCPACTCNFAHLTTKKVAFMLWNKRSEAEVNNHG